MSAASTESPTALASTASKASGSGSNDTDIRESVIATKGASIRVCESGLDSDPDNAALVFLHYWGGSSRTWEGVVRNIGGKVRTVRINQRGWGKSTATDERYELAALADDVEGVTNALKLKRYVLVGHSMGAKVSQLVASRKPAGLVGLLLIAPAPPTPMQVPEQRRQAMIRSYGSREGIQEALTRLAGSPLSDELRERVIEGTLNGAAGAKTSWPTSGMIEDISAGFLNHSVKLPVTILVGERDAIERESVLRDIYERFLPQANFVVLKGVGHLAPLEAPQVIAAQCQEFLHKLSQ